MPTVTPNYLELTCADLPATQRFYESALGFAFTAYGDAYAAVEGGPFSGEAKDPAYESLGDTCRVVDGDV